MVRSRERGTGNREQKKIKKMSDINDFKDLRIWQKGMDIAEKCYFLTKKFPKDELYGMVEHTPTKLKIIVGDSLAPRRF